MGKFKTKFHTNCPFLEHYLSFIFFSSQTRAFSFYSISIVFQSLSQTFVSLKKVSNKYAKSVISLKFARKICVLKFSNYIMVLTYVEYIAKKQLKWIIFSLNLSLVKFIFSRFSHIQLLLFLDKTAPQMYSTLPCFNKFFKFQIIYCHSGQRTNFYKIN